MNSTAPLTPKQKAALDFIVDYHKKHGVAPCYREIHRNPANAMRLVDELCARGYLRREGSARRRNVVVLYDAEAKPDWQSIAGCLIVEARRMRTTLERHGLSAPAKSVDY